MELWNDVIEAFMKQGWGNGVLAERRKQQTLSWVYTMVEEHLHNLFYRSPAIIGCKEEIDPTRVANSFVFMPILVNEMNKLGIKDEDMHIVFALGTHRNMTHEEMVEAVGAEVAGRLKMYNSDAKVSEDFEYFGDTSRGTPVWLNKHICHVDRSARPYFRRLLYPGVRGTAEKILP